MKLSSYTTTYFSLALLGIISLWSVLFYLAIIDEVYEKCKAQQNLPKEEVVNYVKDIYRPFSDEEISRKIAQMLTPEGTHAEVEILFQTFKL